MNVAEQRAADAAAGLPACIVCGCTPNAACDGGCGWKTLDPPVCDRCCGATIDDFVGGAEPADWQPCPLDEAHDSPHVFWQARPDGRRVGVRVCDQYGTVLIYSLFDRGVTAADVAAMIGVARTP